MTLAIVCASVILLCGIYCLIAFTPLRVTIPGYPDAKSRKAAVTNLIKIDSLENIIIRWDLYTSNLQRALSGQKAMSLDSLVKSSDREFLHSKSLEEISSQDSLLREEIRSEGQFGISHSNKRELPLDGLHFFSPAKGVIIKGFLKSVHEGTDISAPAGTVVRAVMDGTVIYDGWDETNGYVIAIQHSGELISIYKNNQTLLKHCSDKVKAGTTIALIGDNSKIGRPSFLHLELWHKGEAVDPAKYITF